MIVHERGYLSALEDLQNTFASARIIVIAVFRHIICCTNNTQTMTIIVEMLKPSSSSCDISDWFPNRGDSHGGTDRGGC